MSHLSKIALIAKQSFTPNGEAICLLLFSRDLKDEFSILETGSLGGKEQFLTHATPKIGPTVS